MTAEILRYAAFTVDGKGGNPAGVVLDATSLDAVSFDTTGIETTNFDSLNFDATAFDADTELPGAKPQDAGEELDLVAARTGAVGSTADHEIRPHPLRAPESHVYGSPSNRLLLGHQDTPPRDFRDAAAPVALRHQCGLLRLRSRRGGIWRCAARSAMAQARRGVPCRTG